MINIIKKVFKITEIKKTKLFLLLTLHVLNGFALLLRLEMIKLLVNFVTEGKNEQVSKFALLLVGAFGTLTKTHAVIAYSFLLLRFILLEGHKKNEC